MQWHQPHWKNVLVCGAGGYIGSHVVRRLLTRGCRVIAFDDLSVCRSWNRLQAHAPALALVTGDLLDRDLLCIVCHDVDVIVHCAGVEVAWPAAAFQDLVAVAVTGTLNLIDAACACGYPRVVRIGAVLPAQVADDQSIHATHRLVESLLVECSRQADLQSLVLRVPEVYGPLQDAVHPSVTPIASLLEDLRQGLVPLICGDPAMPRDWLHIDDLTDAIESACFAELGSESTLELGSGNVHSIKSILDHLKSRGVKAAGRYRRSAQRPPFAACTVHTNAQRVLNVQARHDLFNALNDAVHSLIPKD